MAKPIYLDYNATTPIDSAVREAMLPYLGEYFGNPSTTHAYGQPVKEAVERARQHVAFLIGAVPEEVIFTSGGSESDNQAIIGTALANSHKGKHIITMSIEHPAVLNTCRYLEQRLGFRVTYLPVDRYGLVDPEDVRRAITKETILITIMHANNEVGTIEPIAEIGEIARDMGIIFHIDATQSCGKIPVDANELKVDLLTLAGHKLYAPKGSGALFIRKGVQIDSLIHGAGQEKGRRANENIRERGKGRGKAGKSIQALFRARVFCPKCGHVMRLHRDSKCSWLTYYVCRTKGCGMRFTRVSWLDQLGWDETTHLLQNPAIVEARLQKTEKDDGGIQKRIRLELFHKRDAERKITKIQDDLLNDEPVTTRKEATSKIGELRAAIEKADIEIARLQGIVQVAKQSEEKMEATKKALEKLRDMNLQTATFQQKVELVARLGVKIYPSEDLTYVRIYCGLNITEPQKVSCYKTSIASPKL